MDFAILNQIKHLNFTVNFTPHQKTKNSVKNTFCCVLL